MKTVIDKIYGTEYFINEEGKAVEYDGSMYILDEKEKTARLLYVKKIKYGLFGKKDGVLRIPNVVKYGLKSYTVIGCGSAYFTGYASYDDFHKDNRYKGGGYTTRHHYKRDFRVATFDRAIKYEVKKLIFPDTWTEESIRINSSELPEIESVVLPKSTIRFSCPSCDNIKSITLPENVTEIEGSAFADCKSLEQVNIPNTVKRINYEAFHCCSSLKTITIPEGVTEIGRRAFADCKSLEQVNIPNTVKRINDEAFHCCSSLKTITIPEGVTEIGRRAFADCKSLEQVNIPNTVKQIGDGAFYRCESLKTITIPEGVTILWNTIIHTFDYCSGFEDGLFYGCESLKTITIPEGVTEIGTEAFYHCKSLEQVNIPNTVKQIGDGAFHKCESLKAITIPEGVTEIGRRAFADCKSLEQVNIPNTVKQIWGGAFYRCESLKTITIPEGLTYIWNDTFVHCNSLEQIIIPSKALTDDLRRELKYSANSQIKIIETGNTTPKHETLTMKEAPAPKIEQMPKTEPKEVKPAPKVEGDYKKSAVSGCYTIGIKKDNKVVVSKGGNPCDNTMAVLREIAAAVGFTIETKWNTQQTGSKLVDFINGK